MPSGAERVPAFQGPHMSVTKPKVTSAWYDCLMDVWGQGEDPLVERAVLDQGRTVLAAFGRTENTRRL